MSALKTMFCLAVAISLSACTSPKTSAMSVTRAFKQSSVKMGSAKIRTFNKHGRRGVKVRVRF